MKRSILGHVALAGLVGLASCGSGGGSVGDPAAPFQFRTAEDITIGVVVQKNGAPVSGATVSLVATRTASTAVTDTESGAQWFSGGTDDSGRCDASVAIPASIETVDVVVEHQGSRGSYTDEGLRTLWGPFAPAARVTVGVSALGNLVIQLEDA
ncbi:MAG: hypothetical protein AB7T19_05700 [Planctomycetota bacterium]